MESGGSLMGENKKLDRVLIVDDDEAVLSLMEKIFKAKGIRTHLAHDGLEAKKYLESGDYFDAVILDIYMPRMNGFQLCEYIGHEYPVILVSGAEDGDIPEMYLDLSDALLSKEDLRRISSTPR